MIISLIGFVGAGKTTIAKELAKSVQAPVIDLDTYIAEKENKSISQIFAEVGEAGFRKLELECFEDVLEGNIAEHPETIEDMSRCTLVLSLGGGIVLTPECRDLISRFTFCIYVKQDLDVIFDRLSKDPGDRPLLQSREGIQLRERLEGLFREREPLYEALAQKILS